MFKTTQHNARHLIRTQQTLAIIITQSQSMQKKEGILHKHLVSPPYFTSKEAWPKEIDIHKINWFLAELVLESGCFPS